MGVSTIRHETPRQPRQPSTDILQAPIVELYNLLSSFPPSNASLYHRRVIRWLPIDVLSTMADDKSRKSTNIPPPTDPFQTYQTPYERNNRDDQNPFIQFRRFTDEQFSRFFSGLPRIFGLSEDSDKWQDEMRHRRAQFEEGFKKQHEQELEEIKQRIERIRGDPQIKSLEDSWKALREHEEKAQDHHPLSPMFSDRDGPRTELDVYDKMKESKRIDVPQPVTTSESPSKSIFSSFGAVGHDGKWLMDKIDNSRLRESSWGDDTTHPRTVRIGGSGSDSVEIPVQKPVQMRWYNKFRARRMDPFENTDHTIPWLLLSSYSPIYLSNPTSTRLYMCNLSDSVDTPLTMTSPAYARPWCSEVDERAANAVPWADAFEDLLSLQQTGKMPERERSKSGTDHWLSEMVLRGSFGTRWALDIENRLVKQAMDPKTLDAPPALWSYWQSPRRTPFGRCGRFEQSDEDAAEHIVNKALAPPPYTDGLDDLFSSADSIMAAIVEATQQLLKQDEEKGSESNHQTATAEQTQGMLTDLDEKEDELDSTPYTSLATSSMSTSSSSGAHESAPASTEWPSGPKSVISTFTRSVTRTLPDGSVETRLVLRKSFSDGTEENDESVQVLNVPQSKTALKAVDKETQTSTPVQDQIAAAKDQRFLVDQTGVKLDQQDQERSQAQRKGSGWFWT
jgi:hypothetical protein